MLALDWDHTILSLHTDGDYSGSCRELSHSVRPNMRRLIVEALNGKLMMYMHGYIVIFFSSTFGNHCYLFHTRRPHRANTGFYILYHSRDTYMNAVP